MKKSAGVAPLIILLVAGCGATARTAELTGSAEEPGVRANPTVGRTGPLPDGALVDCVEQYSPAAVSQRAFAFDGVVVDIGSGISDRGDASDLGLAGVTFEVREWFSGGRGSTVTVDMQSSAKSYGIGSRLLVSGEPRWGGPALADAIAWGCEFTRYYDPATADSWSRALGEPR